MHECIALVLGVGARLPLSLPFDWNHGDCFSDPPAVAQTMEQSPFWPPVHQLSRTRRGRQLDYPALWQEAQSRWSPRDPSTLALFQHSPCDLKPDIESFIEFLKLRQLVGGTHVVARSLPRAVNAGIITCIATAIIATAATTYRQQTGAPGAAESPQGRLAQSAHRDRNTPDELWWT